MDNTSPTVNASLDSRSQILIQNLPSSVSSPPKETLTNENKEEKTDSNQVQN